MLKDSLTKVRNSVCQPNHKGKLEVRENSTSAPTNLPKVTQDCPWGPASGRGYIKKGRFSWDATPITSLFVFIPDSSRLVLILTHSYRRRRLGDWPNLKVRSRLNLIPSSSFQLPGISRKREKKGNPIYIRMHGCPGAISRSCRTWRKRFTNPRPRDIYHTPRNIPLNWISSFPI